jgi:hypothetical protein
LLLLTALVVACSSFVLAPHEAHAHTLDTQGFSEISQQGDDVLYDLRVDYAALAVVTGIGSPGSAADPATSLESGSAKLGAYLDERLEVLVDGAPCAPVVTGTATEQRQQDLFARVSLRYDCPGDGEHTIRYSVLVGDLDPGHRNVAGYELSGGSGEFLFDAGNSSLVVGEHSALRQVYRFTVLGLEHILGGLDHVLFVVALLLSATRLRDLLLVVTTFTVAHSLTLALVALDVVRIPAAVVEPLIALSIVYVAATSMLGGGTDRFRLLAVFGFGLLHGAGFAEALRLGGNEGWSTIASLLSFNVGVELGQALIAVAVFPLLRVLRKYPWSRVVLLSVTGLIALAGLVWFVERLALA